MHKSKAGYGEGAMVRVDESVKRMYECRGGDKYKKCLAKKIDWPYNT